MTTAQRATPGRQALLDRRERLVGWHLTGVDVEGGELASHLGTQGIAGRIVMFDLPADLIDHASVSALEAGRYVPLVHGRAADPQRFAEHERALRQRGLRLAIADAAPGSPWLAQAGHFSHARLDLRRLPQAHRARYAAALRRHGPKLVAASVSDRETWRDALEAGFDLCEGQWFTQPASLEARTVAPIYGAVLRALSVVRAEAALPEVERALRADPTLAFRLLRYVNSAAFGLRSEVSSLRDAVNLLGFRPLGRWLGLALVTAQVDDGIGAALAGTAITRGRMMELLCTGPAHARDAGDAFMVGLFSVMDAILDMPMERVVQTLSPPPAVAQALLGRDGALGALLGAVEACERPDDPQAPVRLDSAGVDPGELGRAQLQALAWAEQLLQ
jgi:EAL and modified HD-GYP domain-containing signal transduction protein